MTIFDSSVWIAALDADDSQHARAMTIVPNAEFPIGIPEYVAVEVCSVLGRVDKGLADRFIERVLENDDCTVLYSSKGFFEAVSKEFQRYPKNDLSFTDIALLALSHFENVITFDRKLAKAVKQQSA